MALPKKNHAAKKRAANDAHPRVSQRLVCVPLPLVYWNAKRRTLLAVLSLFGAIIILAVFHAFLLMDNEPVSAALEAPTREAAKMPPASGEPFDIHMDGDMPQAKLVQLQDAGAEPNEVHNIQSQPAMMIEVQALSDHQAAQLGQRAQELAENGELAQAVRLQIRAIELEPANPRLKLALAIFYDRLGIKDKALALYRQVLDGNRSSATWLDDANRAAVRQRADYLATSDMTITER